MAPLERAASVRHARRDLHTGRVAVAHEELHERAFGRRSIARVVQRHPDRADDVPPVRLLTVDVPGLGRARVHERMAPLAEVVEEAIGLADDLAKEAALVRMRDQLLELDAFDRGFRRRANRDWPPAGGPCRSPCSTRAPIRPRRPRILRARRTPSTPG